MDRTTPKSPRHPAHTEEKAQATAFSRRPQAWNLKKIGYPIFLKNLVNEKKAKVSGIGRFAVNRNF